MWRPLQYLFRYSFFISFCAAALTLQSYIFVNRLPNYALVLCIGCFTLAGYNAYWLLSKQHFKHTSFLNLLRNQPVHFALLIVGASIGMVLYFLYLTDWRPFVLTGVLSVLYCLPLILHLDQRFWKRIGFLKPVILASVWACATAWWPLIEIGHVENSILLPVCVIRFSLVLMLNIIFDVGDVVQDKQKQISSVATSCSVWIIHVWMVAATLLYLIFTHHFFRLNAEPLQMYAQLLWVVPVLLLYVLSFKVRNYYFYYAITDGMLLLTVLITFLTRNV